MIIVKYQEFNLIYLKKNKALPKFINKVYRFYWENDFSQQTIDNGTNGHTIHSKP